MDYAHVSVKFPRELDTEIERFLDEPASTPTRASLSRKPAAVTSGM